MVIVNFYVERSHSPLRLPRGVDDYAMIACTTLSATLANPACQSALCFILDPEKPDFQAKALRISKEIYRQEVRRLPWFGPYPELLAVLLKGRFGLNPVRRQAFFPVGTSNCRPSESQAVSSRLLRGSLHHAGRGVSCQRARLAATRLDEFQVHRAFSPHRRTMSEQENSRSSCRVPKAGGRFQDCEHARCSAAGFE